MAAFLRNTRQTAKSVSTFDPYGAESDFSASKATDGVGGMLMHSAWAVGRPQIKEVDHAPVFCARNRFGASIGCYNRY